MREYKRKKRIPYADLNLFQLFYVLVIIASQKFGATCGELRLLMRSERLINDRLHELNGGRDEQKASFG